MKVYVIWDPLYEEVVSVHKAEAGAHKQLDEWDGKLPDKGGGENRHSQETYWFEYDEFEVKE